MSENIERDIFEAIRKASKAFWSSLEKDGWDLLIELSISAREVDSEGRTVRKITMDNEEKK